MILAILAGFLLLSSASFIQRRAKLRGAERRAVAAWSALTAALERADRAGEMFLGAWAGTRGSLDLEQVRAVRAAAENLRTATGPAAKGQAWKEYRRRLTPILENAAAEAAAGRLAAALGEQAGDVLDQLADVQRLGEAQYHATWYYNVLIRKSPDTRVVESLGLREREFFWRPERGP
jgi:hypothetical protein